MATPEEHEITLNLLLQDSFDSGEGGTRTGDDGGSSSGGGGGLASALQSEIRRRAEKNAGMLI